jgi:hypothetical protein
MPAAPPAIVVVIVVPAVAAADLGGWWVEAVARRPFTINDPIAPSVRTGRGASMCAWRVLHQVKVHQYPEGEAAAPTSRRTVVEFSLPARQGEPGYLRDVRRVVRPRPEAERPGVLAVQRCLLDVVEIAGSCNSSFGNVLVPGLQRDALQAKPDVVLEVADVAVRGQLPGPGVDVEVAVGEPSLTCSFVALVAVLEVAEEVFGEVLDDGDVLRADCKLLADGLLDDLWFHLRPVLPQPGLHAVHGEAVELVVHVFSGEGHRCSVLGTVSRVPRHRHRGPSQGGEAVVVNWRRGCRELGSFLLG